APAPLASPGAPPDGRSKRSGRCCRGRPPCRPVVRGQRHPGRHRGRPLQRLPLLLPHRRRLVTRLTPLQLWHIIPREAADAEGQGMLGAIAGDVIGSVHEHTRTKTKDFPLFTPASRFTDDTVLTVAVADCLLRGRDYVDGLHDYFHAYPVAGYGGTFFHWAWSRRREPYNSWGNGSAMRASPVAYAGATLEEVLEQARWSAEVTHNHEQGVRG